MKILCLLVLAGASPLVGCAQPRYVYQPAPVQHVVPAPVPVAVYPNNVFVPGWRAVSYSSGGPPPSELYPKVVYLESRQIEEPVPVTIVAPQCSTPVCNHAPCEHVHPRVRKELKKRPSVQKKPETRVVPHTCQVPGCTLEKTEITIVDHGDKRVITITEKK
jgi:hypothetical protein